MTDLYVDLPALQRLADRLGAIHEALHRAKDDFSYAENDLGSDVVARQLGKFSSGWKDGRKTIMDEIANLMNAIKGAYEAYEQSENSIKHSNEDAGVKTSTRHLAPSRSR